VKLVFAKTGRFKASAPARSTYKYDLDQDGVTQSILCQWLDCRERCRKSTILGLVGGDASKPLIFGSISHEMLEHGYRARRVSKPLPKTLSMDALAKWKKQSPNASAMATEIAEESAIILHHLLPLYFEHWKKADDAMEWVGLEEEFAQEVEIFDGGTTRPTKIIVRGKKDAVVKCKGKITLFETKNKGRISPSLMDQLPLDLQLDFYLTVMRIKEPALRVLYNIIKRPGERRKVGESLNDFGARIALNARKKPDEFFFRYEMVYTKQDLEQRKARFMYLLRAFYDWYGDAIHIPVEGMDNGFNHQSCEGKYGTCEFLRACSSGSTIGLSQKMKAHPELES
jgi:hypothetical protein